MDNKNQFDDVFESDAEKKREKVKAHKETNFKEYLEMLQEDPSLAQNSSARILEIIATAGIEDIPDYERWTAGVDKRYKLFSSKLFGVEKSISELINYFKAGAFGLSTGRQILLLVGPTGSGKSTCVSILKNSLKDYVGKPVFMIKGCPMQEEPLHLLPHYLRDEVAKRPEDCDECSHGKRNTKHLHLGIKVEGDLCPQCRYKLLTNYKNKDDGVIRWWSVPVETFTFSIQQSRGIASFEPSDEKSSDVTELVGRENIAVTSTKGPDDPFAYSLSGELEKANRGIFEGRELIKADEKLLWVFISAAEEREIKVQGSSFPHISIDVSLIGHTNLTEFKKFASRQENEALHDRIYVVSFPYPLKVKREVEIYKKLIEVDSSLVRLRKCHIAPDALEIAAIFAVMTRLIESKTEMDLLTKLKVYNGDVALTELRDKEKHPIDIRELIAEGQENPDFSKREGMFGVSSRDVLAALNTAVVEQSSKSGCLTPLTVIRALRDVFDHRMGYVPEDIERFKVLLSSDEENSVMSEYKDLVITSVSKAFLKAYSDLKHELFRKYVEEAERWRDKNRTYIRGQMLEVERDPVTGKPKEADEKFLRSIEEQIPLADKEAEVFRGEILELRSMLMDRKQLFNCDTYRPLGKAVEEKLLADSRSSLTLVLATDRPKGQEEKKRIDDLYGALKETGHCNVCIREKVEKAREFLSE